MTGRELIMYILENGLEDEPVFKDGRLIGHLTAVDVAERECVGTATVYTWLDRKQLGGFFVSNIFIPANYKSPLEDNKI